MRITLVTLILVFLFGCTNSEKALESDQAAAKPILETNKIAKLTNEQEKIIQTVILADIQLYTNSCKEREERKSTLTEIVFIKIHDNNPPHTLLRFLNKHFDSDNKFTAAKKGVSVFNSEILTGYKHSKNNRTGYLISIPNVEMNTDSTASLILSESRASLSGVTKKYQLKKTNSDWHIVKCDVEIYS